LYFYIASLLKQQSTGIRCVTEGSSPLKRWEMKTTSSVASNWNVSERAFFVKLKIHSDISFIWIIWVLLVCHKWGLGFWCLMQFQFSVSVLTLVFLQFQKMSAIAGIIWIVGRVFYALGYYTGGNVLCIIPNTCRLKSKRRVETSDQMLSSFASGINNHKKHHVNSSVIPRSGEVYSVISQGIKHTTNYPNNTSYSRHFLKL
jgi:hypothetical protein